LRLDSCGRPCAIDVAARLPGLYPQDLLSEMLGLSQVEATLLAVTDPAALALWPPDYESPTCALAQVFLAVPGDEMVLDGDVLAEIAEMPGVESAFGGVASGEPAVQLSRTIDFVSTPGGWNLTGDRKVVESAATAIRALEPRLYWSLNRR
jgi:hypothetical protein